MPLLEVNNLHIQLQTPRGPALAVRGIQFAMAPGDTLGLVGESGCGKSLTAMALLGLLPAQAVTTGSILFQGQELTGRSDADLCRIRGKHIGMVFQEPMTALNPVQTIGNQVAEPLRLHERLSRSAARLRALDLLERVGIPDAKRRLNQYPHQFSGGQRQRITIAMALACNPQLLIADEPTTALDVTVQQQILDLIRSLVDERGMALLLISHDLGVIAQNVSRMLVMYGGSVVESGPTSAVFASMAHPYTRGLLMARPRLDTIPGKYTEQIIPASHRPRLATIAGTVPELADLPPGCPFAGRCTLTIDACYNTPPAAHIITTSMQPRRHHATTEPHQARCLRLDAMPAWNTLWEHET